jgi:energy-coupling factor transporter ATP-binding protein EcfA2
MMSARERPAPCFIYGNIVFPDLEDPWAVYRLQPQSYAGLSAARKIAVMSQLNGLVQAVEADFQIHRVARPWSIRDYISSAWQTFDRRHGSDDEIARREKGFEALLHAHAYAMEDRPIVRPEVYLVVRLREAGSSLSDLVQGLSLRRAWSQFSRSVGLRDARGLSHLQLQEIERVERRTQERVLDYLECDRALASEIAWLVRHAYVRAVADPGQPRDFRPQALAIESEDGDDVGFEPFQWDLHRLHLDHRVTIGSRHLEIESERGRSFQTGVVCGSLPEEREFPGPEAELMFGPLDLEFPVDAALHCEYLPNRDAQRLARKRMVDADQMWREEAGSEHGASPDTEDRPAEARALQRRLGDTDHPPLVRTSLIYMLSSSAGLEELEERVERLRAEVGQRIELHRPIAAQHEVFRATIPALGFGLSAYREFLLPEEVAAMVPTASSHAGSEIGPYIGHTLTPSRQPVRIDLAEPAQRDLPTSMLITGEQGSGKTTLLQLLEHLAYWQGSAPIVVIDPRGTPEEPDHRIHQIPEIGAETEQILLSDDERWRGLIDPLRVAPAELRADLAFDFAIDLLPGPVPAPWQTEIRAAIEEVAGSNDRPQVLGTVTQILEAGNEPAREASRALAVHANAGLAKLGFGLPEQEPREVGRKRVILLQTKALQLPLPGTARSEMSAAERLGTALLRLIAIYALRLCTERRDQHSIFSLDEAWVLFSTSIGRRVLAEMARSGRFQNVTALFSTQLLEDVESVKALIGAFLSGGVKTTEEAKAVLQLHGLDPDPQQIQRLLGYERGKFLFTDYDARTVPIQVDPCDPASRQTFVTTPPARSETGAPTPIGV